MPKSQELTSRRHLFGGQRPPARGGDQLVRSRRRSDLVAALRARHPPATDLPRLGRIDHVEDLEHELVAWIASRVVGPLAGQEGVAESVEPHEVGPDGLAAGGVEESHPTWLARVGDVEELDARGTRALLLDLAGHGEEVVVDGQVVRSNVRTRQLVAIDHRGAGGMGDVDHDEVVGGLLRRDEESPTPVGAHVHRETLAAGHSLAQ